MKSKKKITPKKKLTSKKPLPKKSSKPLPKSVPIIPSSPSKPEEKENILTVDGSEFAPISLKKFIDNQGNSYTATNEKDEDKGKIMVLINNSGNGFVADDPNTINVMITDRVTQAHYFIDEVYPQLPRLPAYLYRYIKWIMFDDGDKMKYPTDNDFIQAFNCGIVTKEDEEYKRIDSFVKWGKTNTEATHLIGLLQLVGGTLRAAAKQDRYIRFFIELPETGFHPKRERLLMSLLYKLQEEYGTKKNYTRTD